MSAPGRAPSRAPNLGDLFRGFAHGERPALVDTGRNGRTVAYRALDRECDAVARGLAARGLGRGDRVAILSLNRAEYVAVIFGTVRAGCVPVPVNIKLPQETIRFILADADVRLVFAESRYRSLVQGNVAVVDLDESYQAFLDPGPFASAAPQPGQVSMQPYTAGTTGRPKGVLLTHAGQAWAARILAEQRRISADERMLISAPFFHKNAIVAIKTALVTGASLVILPRFDAAASIDAIERHRCTTLTGVPTMMHLLLLEIARRGGADLSSVRAISIGSAPASPTLLDALARSFPEAAIHLNYGITEGGPISFGWFHPDGLPRPVESIGYPMPGCELRFEGGPHEREGELWVRNPGVALGYHNLPEETAARFVDGWYRTGDILRQDADGWCYFLGRVDDMFVCGGENIYPHEVETMLEAHPDIAQAVVLDFAHEIKGRVPYAFVVARDGAGLDEGAVQAFALERGPAYAHPRRVFFLDEIPLTGANKVDRAALRALVDAEPPRA